MGIEGFRQGEEINILYAFIRCQLKTNTCCLLLTANPLKEYKPYM